MLCRYFGLFFPLGPNTSSKHRVVAAHVMHHSFERRLGEQHIMFARFLSALCSGKAVDGAKLAHLHFSKLLLGRLRARHIGTHRQRWRKMRSKGYKHIGTDFDRKRLISYNYVLGPIGINSSDQHY